MLIVRKVLWPLSAKQMMSSSVTKNPKEEKLKEMYKIAKDNRLYPLPPEQAKESPYVDASSRNPISRAYVWGLSSYGALGIPEYLQPMKKTLVRYKKTGYFKPVVSRHHPVRCSRAEVFGIVDISCGFGFTLFVTKNKEHHLLGSGLNKDGQIGHHLSAKGKACDVLTQPSVIKLPSGVRVSQVSCGRAHSLILSKDGRSVFTLGNNAFGQCGRDIIPKEDYFASKSIYSIPGSRFGDDLIVSVVAGQDHSLFLSEGGRVYSCGWSADGQTGLGHYKNEDSASLVQGDIQGEKIIKLACAADCVLALNDRGEVFGWGNAEYGQFNFVSDEQQVNRPTALPLINQLGRIIDIASGGSVCYVLNDKHELYAWGFGILGAGNEVEYSTRPTLLSSKLFGQSEWEPDIYPAKVYSGIGTNAVVNSSGDLYMWGKNRNGCLGVGDTEDRYVPAKVYLEAELKHLSLGVDHSAALC